MTPSGPQIGIIIPAFKDTDAVTQLVSTLLDQDWHVEEMVISVPEEDTSPQNIAHTGVHIVRPSDGRRGRAVQMNTGAAAITPDLYVFLHADTRLPDTAREQLINAYQSGFAGGGFSRRFDSPSRFLNVTCRLADLRANRMGWFFGDQAQFVRRDVFEQLGGFPEMKTFEDLEFSRRLRRVGKTTLLKPGVISSARRFQRHGPGGRTLRDFGLTLRYLFGAYRRGHTGKS